MLTLVKCLLLGSLLKNGIKTCNFSWYIYAILLRLVGNIINKKPYVFKFVLKYIHSKYKIEIFINKNLLRFNSYITVGSGSYQRNLYFRVFWVILLHHEEQSPVHVCARFPIEYWLIQRHTKFYSQDRKSSLDNCHQQHEGLCIHQRHMH